MYKTELIKPRRPWRNANHVEAETATYLDWFNNLRLYECCGDMPPVKVERIFYSGIGIEWGSIVSISVESPGLAGGIHYVVITDVSERTAAGLKD